MSEFTLGKYMSKPSELQKPDQILLMGPYGGGKTYLAASASLVPELRKVLIIDTEGSTVGTTANFDDEHLHILNIREQAKKLSKDKGVEIHPVQFFELVMDQVFEHEEQYGTVVIDALDRLNDMYLDYTESQAELEASGAINAFYKWTETRDLLTSHRGLIQKMKDASFLSILVMHEQEDENTGRIDFAWTGKGARSDLGGIPDLVMRVTRVYDERSKDWTTKLVSAPTKKGQAKSRFNKIPEVIEDAVTMADLWNYLESDNKKNKKNTEKEVK